MNNWMQSGLSRLEDWGNRLPHPVMLFIWLCLAVWIASALGTWLDWHAVHPLNGKTIDTVNLVSQHGVHRLLESTVTNFTQFAPVGPVLVAVLGIGIAERSGLLAVVLRALVAKAPAGWLSTIVVFTGVLSSLAADTGYVVLIPLSALVFQAAGRSPIAGIAAAFAGVSGGYSANLLVGPVDVILSGLSTEAAQLLDSQYEVLVTGNYYFIILSTVVVSFVGGWITDHVVSPRLPKSQPRTQTEMQSESDLPHASTPIQESSDCENRHRERRGLRAVGIVLLVMVAVILACLVPEQGWLRDPNTGGIIKSPFMSGIVVLIALIIGILGIVYGRVAGTMASSRDVITGMESTMATMAGYLVLMFFAAQFVNYFAWTNLGVILAIKGSSLLAALSLPAPLLISVFILLAASMNLFVGSASAKWAIMAPIFVPMLMLSGISPELTQMAYRIGDSSTNIVTPLMPYFALVVAFSEKYQREFGIGSLIATMIPYSIAFILVWSLVLVVCMGVGLPLGPGVSFGYAP